MKKFDMISENDRKRMKSFLSVDKVAQAFRDLSPESLATLSIEEIYNNLIGVIDLIRFIRKEQELVRKHARLNQGMMEINPSFANVGGLIKITVKANPVKIFTEKEENILQNLQQTAIVLKRQLLADETPRVPKFYGSIDPSPEASKVLNRKKSRKQNSYHARRRRRQKQK